MTSQKQPSKDFTKAKTQLALGSEFSTLSPPLELSERTLFSTFEKTLQHARHGYIGVGRDGSVLLYTGREIERWGRPANEVLGRKYDEIVTNPEGARRMRIITQVLDSGEGVEESGVEYNSARRGKVVQNLTYSPIKTESGRTVGVLIEVEDLTRQRMLDEIDRDISSGLNLDAILKKICDGASTLSGVWKGDPKAPKAAVRLVADGRVFKVVGGGASAEEGGWTPAQLESLYESVGPASRVWQRMTESGKPVVFDRTGFQEALNTGFVSRENAKRRGIFSMAALPLGGMGDLRVYNKERWDVEDIKFLQSLAGKATIAMLNADEHQRALDAEGLANARLKAMKQLTRLILHDVKNPLVTIGGFARNSSKAISPLSERIEGGESISVGELAKPVGTVARNMRIIIEEIDRIERLIEHSRDSVVDGLSPKSGRVALKGLIEDAVKIHGVRAENQGTPFHVNVPDGIVDALAVEDDVRRIVQNLVQNALDHVRSDGEVNVKVWDDKRQLNVGVSNTGEHIPREKMKTIFEGVGASEKEHGWGVGLSGVRELVTEQGGKIDVYNGTDDRGRKEVSFVFTLPRYE